MSDDLVTLHDMGLYVQDIRDDNYINGELVDFSHSCVRPKDSVAKSYQL